MKYKRTIVSAEAQAGANLWRFFANLWSLSVTQIIILCEKLDRLLLLLVPENKQGGVGVGVGCECCSVLLSCQQINLQEKQFLPLSLSLSFDISFSLYLYFILSCYWKMCLLFKKIPDLKTVAVETKDPRFKSSRRKFCNDSNCRNENKEMWPGFAKEL